MRKATLQYSGKCDDDDDDDDDHDDDDDDDVIALQGLK